MVVRGVLWECAADQGQGQTMMFGHMLLLDCITSALRFSMSTRLQPCHPKVLVPPPGSSTSVLLDRFMVVLVSPSLPRTHLSREPGSVEVWARTARAEGEESQVRQLTQPAAL